MLDEFVGEGRFVAVAKYYAESYVQHNPDMPAASHESRKYSTTIFAGIFRRPALRFPSKYITSEQR